MTPEARHRQVVILSAKGRVYLNNDQSGREAGAPELRRGFTESLIFRPRGSHKSRGLKTELGDKIHRNVNPPEVQLSSELPLETSSKKGSR